MSKPERTAGAQAAAVAADASAERAEEAASAAADSADQAMAAAARVAVTAALVPFEATLATLANAVAALQSDEATDDEQTTKLGNFIASLQQQFLWVTSGAFLLGAAISYVLTKAFE